LQRLQLRAATTDEFSAARILLVDDQEANLRFLEDLLEENGYTDVRRVADSRLVFDTVAEYQPDLILLDLLMPHVDGYAVLQHLQPLVRQAPCLPVLVLTADKSPETRRRALAAGAKDFLAKPLDLVEVQLRIRNLLETRFLHLRLHCQN